MGLWSKLKNKKKRGTSGKNKLQTKTDNTQEMSGTASDIPKGQLQPNLNENISLIKKVTGNSSDIIYREIEISSQTPIKATVVAIEGLVDTKVINEFILHAIMSQPLNGNQSANTQDQNSNSGSNSQDGNNKNSDEQNNNNQNSNNQNNVGQSSEQNNSNQSSKTQNNGQSNTNQNNNQNQNNTTEHPIHQIKNKLLPVTSVKEVTNWEDLFKGLMAGEAILLLDGMKKALTIDSRGGEKRSITEPQTEVSIFGPKDSFTESIATNTSLIRKRINNPNLWLESFVIGEVSHTTVQILYINGIANDKIVNEVKKRLKQIKTDQILDPSYIRQFIENKTFTSFPTVYYTERPDIVTANLMEGRIAIFVDGSPFALTVPALFVEFFQSVDDYYSRFDISFFIRILRVATFFIAMILPSTYVAITTFHQEMAPTLLIIAIAAQREAVPFPAYFEALLMELTFEILREAGIRLPRAIGQAVSIVGALVIGHAAIQANIVSPAMVIIVSFTAISNFSIPSFEMAISTRIIRFFLMTLAAVMGMYGVICGLMFVVIHLNSLRSFGIPYMSPLSPTMSKNLGDTLIRLPFWLNKTRPKLISQTNIEQVGPNQKPHPPKQGS